MKRKIKLLLIALFCVSSLYAQNTAKTESALIQSPEPPVIPVGEDAYLQWDRLPYQRIGVRAYMRSTYDREGNNRGADASHFLYQESDTFNVTLDVKGNGILYFVRTNHFHGSPWHYEVDGDDFIIKETATDNPIDANIKYKHTEFIPQELFPHPLTWTWTTTKGADLMWRPVSFENSFRLAYGRTFYGTGYYIYHLFPKGIKHVSRPITSWNKKAPDPKVLNLINMSGTDIAPRGDDVVSLESKISLEAYEQTTLCNISDAPGMIRAIKFKVPHNKDFDFGKCRLTITWDKRWHPSVDVPVDLFFGAGNLNNINKKEFLVKGFPMNIRYDEEYVYLNCYYPMPFFENAKVELKNMGDEKIENIEWEIRYVPYTDPINHVSYFHATYSNHKDPVIGEDITFLDTKITEGGGDWSGNFVGMSWIFSEKGDLHILEGDPRFFFDDSKTPQAWGTGSEEWGGGGDYWGGENMTIPFAGHPVGKSKNDAQDDKDLVNSAYRFLIADNFPFGKRAVINLEHGGLNTHQEHFSGVVYWYGIDAPSLILTDELNVCNTIDMNKHQYISPTASKPYALVSRFELGPDRDIEDWGNPKHSKAEFYGARSHYPAHEDSVRTMNGTSRFVMELYPENLGVLLRRKFDYGYPNQHAKVFVREYQTKDWKYAGEWYTAGSNTCVYSRPRGKNFSDMELAPTEHNIITSNRRWREEEFLIGRELTEDVTGLEIKIEHIPNSTELFPGIPFPEKSLWSESRYKAYCYVMPFLKDDISKGAYNPATVVKELKKEKDFIKEWMIIGPFDNTENKGFNASYPPEKEIMFNASYQGLNQKVKWQKVKPALSGKLSFANYLGTMNDAVVYAVTKVWSPDERKVSMLLGSDDGAIVWLNNNNVYSVNMVRGAIKDDDEVIVELKKGWNDLLVKVSQLKGGWGLFLRFDDPEQELKYSINK